MNNKNDKEINLDPLNNLNILNKRIIELCDVVSFNVHNHKDLGISKIYKFKPNKSIYDEDSWT